MWATFADKKIHTDDGIMPVPPTPVLRGFGRVGIFPAAVLSALGLLFGMSPALAGRLPYAFGQTLEPVGNEQVEPLALWRGWSLELGLRGISVALGIVLFIARRIICKAQENVTALIGSGGLSSFVLA